MSVPFRAFKASESDKLLSCPREPRDIPPRTGGTFSSSPIIEPAVAAGRLKGFKPANVIFEILLQLARKKISGPKISRVIRGEFAQRFNDFPKTTFAGSSPLSPGSLNR
jgi:hypothetical protein